MIISDCFTLLEHTQEDADYMAKDLRKILKCCKPYLTGRSLTVCAYQLDMTFMANVIFLHVH